MWMPKERLRVAHEVARQLQAEILGGRYHAGDKLPPERKLAEMLGVNRGTLREALKQLEHVGLVRSRQGDGTHVLDFVQTAGLDILRYLFPSVAESSEHHLLSDVLEFRRIIGREVARLAAGRARPEQIESLARVAARPARTPEETLQQDLDFYVELARATGNMVFLLLLNTVRGTVRSLAGLFADFNPAAELVHDHHQQLIAALRARDSEGAARASDRHLELGKEHLLQKIAEDGPVVLAPATAAGEASRGDPAAMARGDQPPQR